MTPSALHGDARPSDLALGLAVALPTFLARLPFLLPGYGLDPDAWRVAHAGWHIGTTGSYMASRDPGFPVVELAAAVLWRGGPLLLNGATAAMSALAAACFALVQRKALQSPAWACLLGGLAFACVPAVFVASTTAMDYVWALACLVASTYALVSGRAVLAGVLLGLAIGCRLTSVLLCLPLAGLAVLVAARGRRARDLVALLVPAGAVALLAYALVLAQGKWSFDVVRFFGTQVGRVTGSAAVQAPVVLRRASTELWGDVGCVALACAALALAVPRLRHPAGLGAALRVPLVVAALIAIPLVAALFLRMPIEAGYLIPLVPFVLWLLAALLRTGVFAGVCCGLLLAPWIGWSARPGPLLREQSARRAEMEFVQRSSLELRALERPAKVVAGRWYMLLEQQHRGSVIGSAELLMRVRDKAQVESYLRSGFELYYLPGAQIHNRLNRGFDLDAHGFEPLFERSLPEPRQQ